MNINKKLKMEQIIYNLNGINYLLIEELITPNNKRKMQIKFKAYDCIYQGIKEISKDSWFRSDYAIIKILVPEKNIVLYNNDDN